MRFTSQWHRILTLLIASSPLHAQRVLIRHARPTVVVEALKAELLSQNFAFVNADERGALFTLDRGVIPQEGLPGNTAHIVLELRVRFRPQADALEVTAWEEVVARFPSSRQRVRSRKELESLQRLLDKIRTDLEARLPPRDSAGVNAPRL